MCNIYQGSMNGYPTVIKKDSTADTQTESEEYATVMFQDTVGDSDSDYSTVRTNGDSVSVANGLKNVFNSSNSRNGSVDLWSAPGTLSKSRTASRKRPLSMRSMGTCEMGVQTDTPLDVYV